MVVKGIKRFEIIFIATQSPFLYKSKNGIKTAFFQITPSKAGPLEGLFGFYVDEELGKKYWHWVSFNPSLDESTNFVINRYNENQISLDCGLQKECTIDLNKIPVIVKE